MNTDSKEYAAYLKGHYSRFRPVYLRYVVYPRYIRELKPGPVYDIGCGNGEFLAYCGGRGIRAIGFDHSAELVATCATARLDARLVDLCSSVPEVSPQPNVVCDNVLEHLDAGSIAKLMRNANAMLADGGTLLVITPNKRGHAVDPTHKTYITRDVLSGAVQGLPLKITKAYTHPLPRAVGGLFVYNMNVWVLNKQKESE